MTPTDRHQVSPSRIDPPSAALCHLLDQLSKLLEEVSVGVYRAPFVSAVSGSIGEHVRHCLDHVSALVDATPARPLSYDARNRGTRVETEPMVALQQIAMLRAALTTWPERSIEEPIVVSTALSKAGRPLTTWSTLARELAFVVNHTIHHQAIIGVLLAVQGHAVPERFGHAPSTPTRH